MVSVRVIDALGAAPTSLVGPRPDGEPRPMVPIGAGLVALFVERVPRQSEVRQVDKGVAT